MKKLKYKREDKPDKRNLILKAAIEVFAKKGYNEASVTDVARRAGIASGTVYLYFQNKVDLFVNTMRTVIGKRLAEIQAVVSLEETAADKLLSFITENINHFTQDKDSVRFMVVEWRRSEDFINLNPGYNPFEEYLSYTESLCREAIASGTIRPVDPRYLAYMILGTMDFTLMQWVSDPEGLDLRQIAAEMQAILEQGLLVR